MLPFFLMVGLAFSLVTVRTEPDITKEIPPIEWLSPTTFNFGTVYAGEEVEAFFRFVNNLEDIIELKDVSPSCGCTVASYSERVLPGKEGFVIAKLNTEGRRGFQHKSIRILFGNGHRATVRLEGKIVARK